MTNLEAIDPDKRDLDYCGHASDTPRPMRILPSFHGHVEGRPAYILVDSGASVNFIARGLIGGLQNPEAAGQATEIGLVDGTTREVGLVHTQLKVELGPSSTTVTATELDLFHFDAIMGMPWLLKTRPEFDWEHQALVMDGQTVWLVHYVTPAEYKKIRGDKDQLQDWNDQRDDNCKKNEDNEEFLKSESTAKSDSKIKNYDCLHDLKKYVWQQLSQEMMDKMSARKETRNPLKTGQDSGASL